jgi:transcriptional regulator with XRE-family HTH domain
MTSKTPSLRQIARGLGISHTTLVLWRQGKRSLRPDLEAKYWAFVTTNGYTGNQSELVPAQRNTQPELNNMVPRGGLEPPTHGFSVHCSTN